MPAAALHGDHCLQPSHLEQQTACSPPHLDCSVCLHGAVQHKGCNNQRFACWKCASHCWENRVQPLSGFNCSVHSFTFMGRPNLAGPSVSIWTVAQDASCSRNSLRGMKAGISAWEMSLPAGAAASAVTACLLCCLLCLGGHGSSRVGGVLWCADLLCNCRCKHPHCEQGAVVLMVLPLSSEVLSCTPAAVDAAFSRCSTRYLLANV